MPCSTESTPKCLAALLNHLNTARYQEDFSQDTGQMSSALLAIAILLFSPYSFSSLQILRFNITTALADCSNGFPRQI